MAHTTIGKNGVERIVSTKQYPFVCEKCNLPSGRWTVQGVDVKKSGYCANCEMGTPQISQGK